jgi:S1-C subfamily serine protease
MAVSNSLLPLVCAGALTFPGMLMQPPRAFAATAPAVAPKSFVAQAVARSGPAVVTLETQRTVRTAGGTGLPRSLMADPFLRRFFGCNLNQLRVQELSVGRAVA